MKKKKFRPLLWIGNFFIWLVPLIFVIWVGAENYKEFIVEADFKLRFEFWTCLVLIIMTIVYWKKGKQMIKDRLLKAFVLEKKANPLLVFLNSVFCLLPLVAVYFIYKSLVVMHTDVNKMLILLIIDQSIGRLFLILDSIDFGGNREDEQQTQ